MNDLSRRVRLGIFVAAAYLFCSSLADCATWITIRNAVVTAVFPGAFYIQTADPVTGIRVEKDSFSAQIGDAVDVIGTIGMHTSGEKYVAAQTVTILHSGEPPKPLGMSNGSLGGWSWRWIPDDQGVPRQIWANRECSTTGLYVVTWGQITEIDTAGQWFYVDDGSCLMDYAKTHRGVRIISGPGTLLVGDRVTVVGIAGVRGDDTTGDPVPTLRPRSLSDIRSY